MPLEEYLKSNDIPAIEGIDTRALTKHIRTAGAMRAVLSSDPKGPGELVEKARSWPGLVGQDMVKWVTCKAPYEWPGDDLSGFWKRRWPGGRQGEQAPFRVVAMDFGIKFNIARIFNTYGCSLTIVPGTTPAQEILSLKPEGIFLSNGPGDPAGVTYAIGTVRELIGTVPVFGICLGHQIMGLALGGKTFKMKFGHRGSNQPVKDLDTGRVYITSQNHGFCVDASTLDPEKVRVTHVNLNDQTLEGMDIPSLSAFSVQHHPEASPGPHDHMKDLFEKFVVKMGKGRR